jgi:hypothetical protein
MVMFVEVQYVDEVEKTLLSVAIPLLSFIKEQDWLEQESLREWHELCSLYAVYVHGHLNNKSKSL